MDKIARIRQKIKELRELLEDHNYYLDNSEQALGYCLALDDIEQFLDTLSEEPDKSLEEEISRTYHDGSVTDTDDIDHVAYENIAHHFAEWQASQMPMPEDTVLFNKGVQEGRRLEREDMLKDAVEGRVFMSFAPGHNQMVMADVDLPTNTKVRIVVLKEEEE